MTDLKSLSIGAILNPGRMISDGVPYAEVSAAEELARKGDDAEWFDHWIERSAFYENIATEAIEHGNTHSGGIWMWTASLCAHYAQFMWFHDPERRERGQRLKVELFDRAAPHFGQPGERIEIGLDGCSIPGYLRIPDDSVGPYPCCVLIGGLESTKEESHLFENLCLERGMATFAFDGPGQGELYFDVKLSSDFERYSSAVLDYLVERPEIDRDRVGILGRSLGGHYAPKSAACDSRFAACCAWGACFDLSDLDTMPPHTRRGFLYVTGIQDEAEAVEYLRSSIDLAAVAGDLECPMLLTHGAQDVIFGREQVDKYREHFVNSDLEIQVEEEGDHCCHNMGQLIRPRMVDWMAHQLGAGA